MAKTAYIIGSGFAASHLLKDFDQAIVKTQYGNVLLYRKRKSIILLRHGKNLSIPSHRINYKANICALNLDGVERIVGINSVGSLKEAIVQGSLIIPDDYIDFLPQSFCDFELKTIIPALDGQVRAWLISAAKKSGVSVRTSGIYVNMCGPRFETAAEISVIRKWGHVVGMTMAKEATLAQELGIPYACICSVDNYAHGIGKHALSGDSLKKVYKKTQPKIEKILNLLMKDQ